MGFASFPYRHSQQLIKAIVGVVEVDQVCHQRLRLGSFLRRLGIILPGRFVFQPGAKQLAQARPILLQLACTANRVSSRIRLESRTAS
jgi:hypothetical protein